VGEGSYRFTKAHGKAIGCDRLVKLSSAAKVSKKNREESSLKERLEKGEGRKKRKELKGRFFQPLLNFKVVKRESKKREKTRSIDLSSVRA